jgi:hypothetical protein
MYSRALGSSRDAINAAAPEIKPSMNGDPVRGRRQNHPDEPADLVAAELVQDIEAIFPIRPIDRNGPPDDVDLVSVRSIIYACASARHVFDRPAGEDRRDRAGRRGVADAHLAGARQVHPVLELGFEYLDPGLHGLEGFLLCHRRSVQHVPGAMTRIPGDQLGMRRQVGGYPHIDHHHSGSHVAGQDIDAGAVRQEVAHHLCRDLRRKGTDAFLHDTVVTRQSEDDLIGGPRRVASRNPYDLSGEVLQSSQATVRLGEMIEPVLRAGRQGRIEGLNSADSLIQSLHGLSCPLSAPGCPFASR